MSSVASLSDSSEWLEADGLGGFASGTTTGIRTRRYHALLLTATAPPAGRTVLVNGMDVWLNTKRGRFALSSQRYIPAVVHPDGVNRLKEFRLRPWPCWRFNLWDDFFVEHELFVPRGQSAVILTWRVHGGDPGSAVKLFVRLFLSGRDFHATHHENGSFRFDSEVSDKGVRWRPYEALPVIVSRSNGRYHPAPDWYRNFLYSEERARGLDCVEDLATPGVFEWDLETRDANLVVSAEGFASINDDASVGALVNELRRVELCRRENFSSRLESAADSYLVRRGAGKTVIAGYPWFGDWGRDTFIALRGLCLATKRLEIARGILLEWAGTVSEGMLPNRFPDRGAEPEFNSVDASLWYIIAVEEFLRAANGDAVLASEDTVSKLEHAVEEILKGYSRGTRFGIHADTDGLLAAGVSGLQLTWMDAKVYDHVITPRIGKPVEVQALWLNALAIGLRISNRWQSVFATAWDSFQARFWNENRGQLYDIVDVDHWPGAVDQSIRPNQIFAVGGLPLVLLPGDRARRVVDAVETGLYTPLGLRSLAPDESEYVPRYEGDLWHRDIAYHQGTAWPWLIGPFVEAWVRVRGNTADAKKQARQQFFEPFVNHLSEAGLGHVSEIVDAEPPHTPRGCPFQAWSLGELLRLDRLVLAEV
jgi:predicted glycogen debranching enzyme